MATDVVVSSELKSLQDELAAARRERSISAAPAPTVRAESAEPAGEPADDHELRDLLTEFIDEARTFIDEAEKTVSAHPARSVLGALIVGLLIGRLLGRR
jgi:ElaB/YqjD/DUF883 family membrane-anchored ribosome-binding protein